MAAIYERIHAAERRGELAIGWDPAIYPVRATAEAALAREDLFVCEEGGEILASAIVNQRQVDSYAGAPWAFSASEDEVMVLHTLTVDPLQSGKGIGSAFVAFYEQYAVQHGCPVLRMDTNARNLRARALYRRLGYREAAIVPCTFNGIPGVQLVLLEKELYAR